jgi:ribosome-associated protein
MNKPEDSASPESKEKKEVPQLNVREIRFKAVRSGGAGGQNVNKVSSKVDARWTIHQSRDFDDEQKQIIRAYVQEAYPSHINQADEIFVANQETRDQPQNKARAIEFLQRVVAEAFIPVAERKATKMPHGAKMRRLDDKGHEKRKKERRRDRGDDGY